MCIRDRAHASHVTARHYKNTSNSLASIFPLHARPITSLHALPHISRTRHTTLAPSLLHHHPAAKYSHEHGCPQYVQRSYVAIHSTQASPDTIAAFPQTLHQEQPCQSRPCAAHTLQTTRSSTPVTDDETLAAARDPEDCSQTMNRDSPYVLLSARAIHSIKHLH